MLGKLGRIYAPMICSNATLESESSIHHFEVSPDTSVRSKANVHRSTLRHVLTALCAGNLVTGTLSLVVTELLGEPRLWVDAWSTASVDLALCATFLFAFKQQVWLANQREPNCTPYPADISCGLRRLDSVILEFKILGSFFIPLLIAYVLSAYQSGWQYARDSGVSIVFVTSGLVVLIAILLAQWSKIIDHRKALRARHAFMWQI